MRARTRGLLGLLDVGLMALACTIPGAAPTAAIPTTSPSTPIPSTDTPAASPVDVGALLQHTPVAGFGPLPPMRTHPGRTAANPWLYNSLGREFRWRS